jgi:hypothetical protein
MKFLTVLLLAGCTTLEHTKQDALDTCPYVQMEYAEGTIVHFSVDEEHHRAARAGCIRHYGPKFCLAKITKTADRSYQVICKKQ